MHLKPVVLTRNDALRPVLVASHPRSGTHLVLDLLRRQFPSFQNWRWWWSPLDQLYLNLERLGAEKRRFDKALAKRIVNRPRRALMKTHFDAEFVNSWAKDETERPPAEWMEMVAHSHIFYVVRHPLDVMASYQQFLSGIDSSIAQLDFVAFLKSEHWNSSIDRLGWWAEHVTNWAGRSGITVLRYEDVIANTPVVVDRVSDVLGEQPNARLPLLPPKVSTIKRSRFGRFTRLSPDSTAIVADSRRFPAVEWRGDLDENEMAWISQKVGVPLSRFGYSICEGRSEPTPQPPFSQ